MIAKKLEQDYPKVYALYKLRYISYYNTLPKSNACIDSFSWSDTPEGHNFWKCLSYQDIEGAKKIHPSVFADDIVSEDDLLVRANGLWK